MFEKDIYPYFEWTSDVDKINNFDAMLEGLAKDNWCEAKDGQTQRSIAVKELQNKYIDDDTKRGWKSYIKTQFHSLNVLVQNHTNRMKNYVKCWLCYLERTTLN